MGKGRGCNNDNDNNDRGSRRWRRIGAAVADREGGGPGEMLREGCQATCVHP
ncbi:hypothetical protein X777_07532 [Ooceraea biroi]|uniref:Uncharacterized protein n=1 Tax=Ooceraea biroi TaxID=2015173 RepID=A0A026X387_OOCBI|nr:hypothetical protein X777_07532 [Ooceraea biroi]